MSAEETLQRLSLELPPPPAPAGSYVPAVRAGDLLFVSGALPLKDGALTHAGKVGAEFGVGDGAAAARQCALNLLAVVRGEAGSLDHVVRVVSLTGFVNGVDGFADSPQVLNGASELMLEVFGDAGRHSRAAVSVNGLPKGAAVEVAGIFQLG